MTLSKANRDLQIGDKVWSLGITWYLSYQTGKSRLVHSLPTKRINATSKYRTEALCVEFLCVVFF